MALNEISIRSKCTKQGKQLSSYAQLPFTDFAEYYRVEEARGHTLYGRTISGPMHSSVELVEDGVSKSLVMLGSNNYLGFADDPTIKAAVLQAISTHGLGMSGPPLLNGQSTLHRELERRLAALKGCEDALLFPSGYQANLGLIDGLMREGDFLIYDEYSHASLVDGLRMVKARHRVFAKAFRHNKLESLEQRLRWAQGLRKSGAAVYLAVEGVYSMDGDIAPLPEIVALAEKYDAMLILDDAHGTGVLGENGAGTCEHFNLKGRIALNFGTFSKAFAMTGGFICGPHTLINYLRFFSRPYLFSAHLPIPTVAAVLAGLELIAREPWRRGKVMANTAFLRALLNAGGIAVSSETPIIPVPIPAKISIRAFNRDLHDRGVFANAIEAPAVPRSKQRLRLSVSASHSERELCLAADVLSELAHIWAFGKA